EAQHGVEKGEAVECRDNPHHPPLQPLSRTVAVHVPADSLVTRSLPPDARERKPMQCPRITTPRLTLRPWCQADLAPFAALNADPRVMEFFPAGLSATESDALAARIVEHFATR